MTVNLNGLQSMAARRAVAERRAQAATAAATSIVHRARHRGAQTLTGAEDAQVRALLAERDAARDELASPGPALSQVDQLRAELDADRAAWADVRSTGTTPPPYDRVARIGRESRTYRPDQDPKGTGFLRDVARNFLHSDPGASARLQRHMAEEAVERPGYAERAAGDSTTTNWAGLTVPQYLTDLYAPQISALRPFSDVCCVRNRELPPEGMTVNFAQITTGTSVSLQSAQLTAPAGTSIDDTLVTANVQTATGWQNVSRQAIERGTGIEDATMQDLFRKHAVAIDTTVLTQAATGVQNIAQATAYTSASPTGAEFYPYLYQAASKLEAALLGVAPPSHVVMHSRRWNWFAAQLSSSWPIATSAGVPAQQAAYQLTNEYGSQVRAVLASGLKVVVDNNVPIATAGTQDEIYLVSDQESVWLLEAPDAPMMIRAEQPNAAALGVLLVVYSYFAYFSRYANAVGVIKGTGTVAPPGF